MSRRSAWLTRGGSDLLAALLLGIVTFSKPWSAFLFPPIVLYLLWRRRLALSLAASAVFLVAALGLFGANIAITGEWNYQGGQRNTYYYEFPFQTPASSFDVGQEKARDGALTDVIFERSVVWTNLVHNLKWFFVGRNAGLFPYFFPAVFALAAFLLAAWRRPSWQYFVLLGALGQIAILVVSVPYTWNGGGGSVGNRYFMGAYGVFLFLLPPIRQTWVAVVPWLVGALFTAPLVLNPFVTSFKPGDHMKSGPLRWLPPELTLVYDWPINNQADRVRVWFGDNPRGSSPGFQLYFFDDNAFVEGDGTFWAKGESRAEFLIKTDRPMKRLQLTLTAGPQPVRRGRGALRPLAGGRARAGGVAADHLRARSRLSVPGQVAGVDRVDLGELRVRPAVLRQLDRRAVPRCPREARAGGMRDHRSMEDRQLPTANIQLPRRACERSCELGLGNFNWDLGFGSWELTECPA